MRIVNVAGYRFVPLDNLSELRERLHQVGDAHCLRGTILLAPEGINFFVAGTAVAIAAIAAALDADPRLAGIEVRTTHSASIPFRRMKVRIKKEIIALGDPAIDPARSPAPAMEPETLRTWLDQRKPCVLVDTRNGFEVKHGTFAGAIHLGNDSFRAFASAATRLSPVEPGMPIVTFCTGGIRCEKAAPLLRRLGHANVYQLAGGILRYFDRVGSAHFDGDCFVFDARIALDAALAPRDDQKPVQL